MKQKHILCQLIVHISLILVAMEQESYFKPRDYD